MTEHERAHDDRMRQYRVDALVQARQFVPPGAPATAVVEVADVFFEFLCRDNPRAPASEADTIVGFAPRRAA